MTTDVENFPGYPQSVNGTDMMIDFKNQATRFGSDIRYGTVTNVDLSNYPFDVNINSLFTHTGENSIPGVFTFLISLTVPS